MGRFSHLRSSEEVGSFDGPFSPSELRRDLGVCVDSAVGLDGVPYSLFKVPFPWWQCALLNFFNLVLSWSVVPTLVTLILKFELVHRSPLHGKIVGLLKGESSPLCSSICSSTPWLLTSGSWHMASAFLSHHRFSAQLSADDLVVVADCEHDLQVSWTL